MRGAERLTTIAIVAVAVLVVSLPYSFGASGRSGPPSPPSWVPDAAAGAAHPPRADGPLAPSVVPRAFVNATIAPPLLSPGPGASVPPISALQVTPVPIPPPTVPTLMTFLVNSSSCCVQANFTAPAGGPWAMVILNYTGQAVGGVYDSSFRAYLDQVQVLFGTTPEYGIWFVSQDVTKYQSLVNGTFNFTFLLSAAVVGGYFLTSVSMAFYPPVPGEAAPTEPDLIVPLFHRVFVSTTTPVVSTVATIPTNVVNATLEMWTYGFGPDEFWYATGQSYRATYVRVDGSPIATVLPFPYINTGGEDLFAWRPITAVFTLSDRPYEFDATAALGLIEGTHNFSANVSGVTTSSNWLIGGALLLYTSASAGPATTLSYRSSSPAPRVSGGTSSASPSYSYGASIPTGNGTTNVTLWTNETFSETIAVSSNGDWNNLTGRETASTHEAIVSPRGMESIDRALVFPLSMDLGQTLVITSTTGGGYPKNANFTTYFLNAVQEWSESTARSFEALSGPVVESSVLVDDRMLGGNNVFAGTEELTAPNAALLLSITFVAASTQIDYTQSEFGGLLTTSYSHLLAGASYQPPGPNEVETVLLNEIEQPLVALLTASDGVLDVGGSVTLSTLAAGGSGTYTAHYSGVPPGCTPPSGGPTGSGWSCSPSSPGVYDVSAVVSDGVGDQVPAGAVTLVVDPLPSADPTTNTSSLDTGQTAYLESGASGGTGALSCQWTVNDSAPVVIDCRSAFSFEPTLAGDYTVSLVAADALGGTSTTTHIGVTVATRPLLGLDPGSDGNGTVGNPIIFTATVTGGSGNSTFVWFVNNSPVTGVVGPVFVLVPSGGARYAVSVESIDGAGVSSFAGPVTWSIYQAKVPAGAASTSGPDLGWIVLLLAVGGAVGAALAVIAIRLVPPRARLPRR